MAVQKLCSVLDSVSPADVGLQEEAQDDDRGYGVSGVTRFNRVGRWAQPMTFLDIHECDTVTMCIFCFPTSSVILLHDHPEMAVLSKILYGSLRVKAYDWVEPPCVITQDKAVPGKTAGRGHKGQKARGTMKFGFEGWQTPLRRRLLKRGFKNKFKLHFQPVGLGKIAKLINAGQIDSHELITMKTLKDVGAIGKQIEDGVRLMVVVLMRSNGHFISRFTI